MGGLGRLYLSVFVFVFVCIGVSIFESYKRWEGMEGRLLPGNIWLGVNYVESHLWLTASRTAVHSTYFSISIFLHLHFFLISFCIFGSLKDSMTIENSHLIWLFLTSRKLTMYSFRLYLCLFIQYRSGKIRSVLIRNIFT